MSNLGAIKISDVYRYPMLRQSTEHLRHRAEEIAPFRYWPLDATLEDTYQLFKSHRLEISAYSVKKLHAEYLAIQAI